MDGLGPVVPSSRGRARSLATILPDAFRNVGGTALGDAVAGCCPHTASLPPPSGRHSARAPKLPLARCLLLLAPQLHAPQSPRRLCKRCSRRPLLRASLAGARRLPDTRPFRAGTWLTAARHGSPRLDADRWLSERSMQRACAPHSHDSR